MNANKINNYPNQILDEYGLCMCGDCLSCRPDLFQIKPNQCVVCKCYNLSKFKKIDRKHIHCLDCYRQVTNAKRRERYARKKEAKKAEGNSALHILARMTGTKYEDLYAEWKAYTGVCEEEVYVCKGCGENIGDNGFCTEGCRYGEFAGVWTCDCGEECKDVEFCPKCPRE